MFQAIANTFANCFKIPELKSRILFTLAVLGICRLISMVPIPGLNGALLADFFEKNAAQGGGLLGMYSMFTGGALERCAVGDDVNVRPAERSFVERATRSRHFGDDGLDVFANPLDGA